MDKKTVRKEINQFFSSISSDNLLIKSRKTSENLIKQDLWNQSEITLAFLTFGKEFETSFLIERALETGKRVAVPRIYDRKMIFHYISSLDDKFEINRWDIREPLVSAPGWSPSDGKTLMLTPGLAFNNSGGRLGRGGGFYDRFLNIFGKEITTVGLCFEEQIRDDFPVETYDYYLNAICSDVSFSSV